MHWLDRVAGLFTARPRFYDPVFADGWGDPDLLKRFRAEAGEAPPVQPVEIAWQAPIRHRTVAITDGSFVSPAAATLPATSRIAALRKVEPHDDPVGICLIMAAFNDHGYGTRMKIARRLACRRIASVLLENPYYGVRRPAPGQPLRTVVDFYAMGAAAVLEGRAVLSALHNETGLQLGVAGYSMGGNIAALISATIPFPIATAGLAASHSPGPVWSEGLLANAIAWEALGGVGRKDDIAVTLGGASALNFPPPPHASNAILAAPTGDGYIPRHAFEALHTYWPGSELRWIGGGHASVLLWRKAELAQAIVDSFARLAAEGRNIQSGPTNS
jgi:hypothetical protein